MQGRKRGQSKPRKTVSYPNIVGLYSKSNFERRPVVVSIMFQIPCLIFPKILPTNFDLFFLFPIHRGSLSQNLKVC